MKSPCKGAFSMHKFYWFNPLRFVVVVVKWTYRKAKGKGETMTNINEKMREQIETMNNSIMHNRVWSLWNVLYEIQNIDEHAKVQVVTGFFPIFTSKPAMPKTIFKRMSGKDENTRVNGVQMQNGIIYVVA